MRSIEEKRKIASQMAEKYLTPDQREALNLKDIDDNVVQKAWKRAFPGQHGGRRRRRKTRRRRKKKGRRKTRAQRGGMEPVTALIILTLLFIIFGLVERPPSDGYRADGTPFGFRRAATRRWPR